MIRRLKFLTLYKKYCLLITFANNFDSDQDLQNVGPGLDPNLLHSDSIPDFFFKKKMLILNNKTTTTKTDDQKACKISQHAKS